MAVYKDKQRGTWYVSVYYTNWKQINKVVAISGLSKQEYCYRRCMQQDIVVRGGNPRVFKALRNNLAEVLEELKNKKEVTDEMLEIIRLITETLRELKGDLSE